MQTAQFRKPTHAADAGVAGVRDLAHVVHHLVAVVGAEGDEVVDGLGGLVNGLHRGVHVDIAVEMI